MCCVAQDTPSPLLRSFPSTDTALTAPECWAEGEEGGEKVNQRRKSQSGNHLRTVRSAAFPSYLCRRHVGRIHDPGLAWGEAAPSREKRQSHKCPPRKRTPPLWKEGQENETYFHSPEGPLVPLVMEKTRQLGKQAVNIPTNTHEAQSVRFPSPGTWSQKCGSPQTPPAGGEDAEWRPCPNHCQLVPRDQDREHMWTEAAGWTVLNQCWGRRKGEGLGWWG